ncbi:squalene/phytoene synthase family protein [Streptomyces sp. NPDC048191]|uniref:squalene/phytoene synthase family protein n=1 Tax=Streptomyces sp. NPDC048191 TaxID=3155484 RepID=UPI0033D5AF7B
MPRWPAALTEAGITDPTLRRAYDALRDQVRKYALHQYLAARLLLPPQLHASVVAMVAFMHETDERIDAGEVGARKEALSSWHREVRGALDAVPGPGAPASALLRALADTSRRCPHTAGRVHAFLDGALVEAEWTGFDGEADYQAYIDSYSLPALMLTMSLIAPAPKAGVDESFLHGCRALIEGWQRIDFLADLAEDAEQGRIGIAREELDRYGLTVEDLRNKSQACVPALGRLVDAQADLAETALTACRGLPDLVDAPYRPFLKALISLQVLHLQAVRRKGGSLLRGGARPSVPAALRILAQQYRAARSVRRPSR